MSRSSRWNIPAAERASLPAAPERARATLREGAIAVDPTRVLLLWTDELDEERAVSLWIGLAAAEDATEQEAALVRWIDWAGVIVPPALKLRDLVAAAQGLLAELDAIAQQPERVESFDDYDRRALTRALRAWIRARENDPAAVLGGTRAVLRSETLGGLGAPRESDRVVLANVLRRNLEKVPSASAAPLFHALVQIDPSAVMLPPYAESIVDFLLLEGELSATTPGELASIATLLAWSNTVRLGLTTVGRPALRAARLLGALAAYPDVARSLEPQVARDVVQLLVRGLQHSRIAVWSRSARAFGRLAGSIDGLAPRLAELLEPGAPALIRRRALTALFTLAPGSDAALEKRRAELLAAADDAGARASFALGLPDVPRGEWPAMAEKLAREGGPETWSTLGVALRESGTRSDEERERVGTVARSLAARASAFKPASSSEAESVDRAIALTAWLASDGADADSTPRARVYDLAMRLAVNPAEPASAVLVEELLVRTDAAVAGALRALSGESARSGSRAGVLLDDVVDLVVDGDFVTVAERIAIGQAREAAVHYIEVLRKKLLKTVWSGLKRPTPTSTAWRRWLLRTAGALPRVEPLGVKGAEREHALRDQCLETLARVADEPALQQPAVQRLGLAAVLDLSEVLRPELGDATALSVLTWLATRTGAVPVSARARRGPDAIPPEALERLLVLADTLAQPGRATDRDLAGLAACAGERTPLGQLLDALAREVAALASHRPEPHWSGLPKLDLSALASLADRLRHAREDPSAALVVARASDEPAQHDSLVARAAKLNQTLTATSLKFVDATRRVEIAQHYVSDLGALCEAIAIACGPLAGTPVRAQLAKALVDVRSQATAVAKEAADDVRYIARLRVLGSLASAGEGGMTNTYLAEGPAPGKRVVVKLLPWERFAGANAEVARTLFEGEMHRLAPIVHPNVVSIVDAGFVDEGAYIALEYIPGASLETVLRVVRRIELARLAPVIADAARALEYLHARGIVHRDIKPGNLLLQLDGFEGKLTAAAWASARCIRAVVIDLGIATDARRGVVAGENGIVGTPGFLAPEIARGLDLVGPAVDVYALAVVAFEALTGTNPYLEGNPELHAVLVRHGTETLPVERLPEPVRHGPVAALLADASKLDPRARPTMTDFLARWQHATMR